ncbi:hypothetical protein SAMD00023353_1000630 [Rosellinia necatrix]|uniref:Uncharacterized protein n=1 Tax=Rosellinia necatrix TaxID=77044 RepID=A0A1S8A6D5_ROSNE|nr:hypothetical protein SAMD00023353_1000630 [Rosellinia necatrix]
MNSVGGLFPSQITTDYDFEVVDFPSHQFELWGLIRRTSQRCAEARAMIPSPGRTIFKSQIIESLDHVLSTYLRLFDWQATLPSSWLWQSCRIPTQEAHDPHQKPFPEKYHLFKNEHHGAMWISFWCTLIHILQTLVHLSALPTVQQVLSHSWHDRWGFRKRLRGAVDEICACAPYMMAEVDQMGLPTVGNDGKALGSFFLSRGLYVASCVEETTGAQRDYIMRTLLRIAHVKGIMLALRARNRCLGKHIGSVEPHD